MAIDPTTQKLYGTNFPAGRLFEINPLTAEATLVSGDGAFLLRPIAFTPDGKLYAVQGPIFGAQRLVEVDPTTGAVVGGTIDFLDRLYTALGSCPNGFLMGGAFTGSTAITSIDPENGDEFRSSFLPDENVGDLTFLALSVKGGNGGGPAEPPTIGVSTSGNQVVTCGVAFDSKCFTITAPFHEEFKLYEMMSGTHTISITMYCANGVSTCNYAAIGIMPYSESMNGNTTWKIELYKDFEGNLTTVKTDPEGFLGTVTVTTQIIDDKFWIVSFTVDFKNKDTGPMMFGVQARDDQNAVRNWYLNEGVEFKDSDAYPSIVTEFDNPLEIDSLCLNEDPTYRNSCAFAEIRDLATQNAEETLRQMLNGEYRYK